MQPFILSIASSLRAIPRHSSFCVFQRWVPLTLKQKHVFPEIDPKETFVFSANTVVLVWRWGTGHPQNAKTTSTTTTSTSTSTSTTTTTTTTAYRSVGRFPVGSAPFPVDPVRKVFFFLALCYFLLESPSPVDSSRCISVAIL